MGKKYSVCFLFGAGAESDLGFPLGTEFITKIITDKESPKFLSKINNYKTNAKYNFLDKRKTSVITQTADEYENGIEDFIRDFSSFGFSQNCLTMKAKKMKIIQHVMLKIFIRRCVMTLKAEIKLNIGTS